MGAVSEDVLAYIDKNKQVEKDGWIFKHKARGSLLNGEVITLRAPCHERPFEDRYEISVAWSPKYVIRDKFLAEVDPKRISPEEDLGDYTWASEKSFSVVVQDLKTGEAALVSDDTSGISLSFIGDFAIKKSHLPELVRDAKNKGFEGSNAECVGHVIQNAKTYSLNYISDPRQLTEKSLSAITKAQKMGANKAEFPIERKKEVTHSPSV